MLKIPFTGIVMTHMIKTKLNKQFQNTHIDKKYVKPLPVHRSHSWHRDTSLHQDSSTQLDGSQWYVHRGIRLSGLTASPCGWYPRAWPRPERGTAYWSCLRGTRCIRAARCLGIPELTWQSTCTLLKSKWVVTTFVVKYISLKNQERSYILKTKNILKCLDNGKGTIHSSQITVVTLFDGKFWTPDVKTTRCYKFDKCLWVRLCLWHRSSRMDEPISI